MEEENIIQTINSKTLYFIFIIVSVISVFVFSNVFIIGISTIFGILLSAIFIKYVLGYIMEYNNQINEELLFKISTLDDKINEYNIESYFYVNPNIVNLLYSIRDFDEHSSVSYRNVLLHTNFFLEMYNNMLTVELKDYNKYYDIIEGLYKECIELFYNISIGLPLYIPTYEQRFKNSYERYRTLMTTMLDTVRPKEVKDFPVLAQEVSE